MSHTIVIKKDTRACVGRDGTYSIEMSTNEVDNLRALLALVVEEPNLRVVYGGFADKLATLINYELTKNGE